MIKDYTMISSKNGDEGNSKNYSNETYPKTDVLFETLGTLDELSSLLGVIYHYISEQDIIVFIQQNLQDIMTLVATNTNKHNPKLNHFSKKSLKIIEEYEQLILNQCNIQPKFVLPGSESTRGGAFLDLSRAYSRKAERIFLRYIKRKKRIDLSDAYKFLNRLSDLLYILARKYDKNNS